MALITPKHRQLKQHALNINCSIAPKTLVSWTHIATLLGYSTLVNFIRSGFVNSPTVKMPICSTYC